MAAFRIEETGDYAVMFIRRVYNSRLYLKTKKLVYIGDSLSIIAMQRNQLQSLSHSNFETLEVTSILL